MDTFEAIEQRRSVKHYDPEHQMTDSEVDKLLSLALLSPTSFNIQNWRFVNVTDKELRQQICTASWNQTQVTDASVLLLLCADLHSFAEQPERYWKDAPEEVRDRMVPMIGQFYAGNDQLQRDEALRSVGIASQTLMLAARSMGYDSCPMIGFDAEAVAKIINLPEFHMIGMMLVIGKAAQSARGRSGQLAMDQVVINNKFA